MGSHSVEIHLKNQLSALGVSLDLPLIVAFSGGPDSLALLSAALNIAYPGPIYACHVDHGLDPESGRRADRAERMAVQLGLLHRGVFLRFHLSEAPDSGISLEAWARSERYGLLRRLAATAGGLVLTAHHREDQAETLLLRLLFGTGLAGLSGIRRQHGSVFRPFLGLPRARLLDYLAALGLEATEDPTNSDCRFPRNRIRRKILPEWNKTEPDLVDQLCRVAELTERVVPRLDRHLVKLVGIQPLSRGSGARLNRSSLVRLPEGLQRVALGALERLAGRPYPASKDAHSELLRQLASGAGKVGCDAGAGWRWYADSRTLRLLSPTAQPLPNFTYTLEAPGSVELVEIGLRATVSRGAQAPWMFEPHPSRVAFSVPTNGSNDGSEELSLEIRNRRPGDRVQPFGSSGLKKLKDLLIDRRVPQEERDRLPIFCHAGRLVWVPGVNLDRTYRIRPEAEYVWIIELHKTDPSSGEPGADPARP